MTERAVGVRTDVRTARRITVQRQRLRAAPAAGDLKAWACAALADHPGPADITIRSVDDAEMRALNLRYRGQDRATNVLSFPLALGFDAVPAGAAPQSASIGLRGDIVICAPVVAAEAAAQHKPCAAHWAHLTVHAVLHLLGYDHETATDAAVMEAREVSVLEGLGIPDPYVTRDDIDAGAAPAAENWPAARQAAAKHRAGKP